MSSMTYCTIIQGIWRWKCRLKIPLLWYFLYTLYRTFAGILYPPSSESLSLYLAVHGIITAHLIVSFITLCRYLKYKIWKHLDNIRAWNLIREDISIWIVCLNQIFWVQWECLLINFFMRKYNRIWTCSLTEKFCCTRVLKF